MNYYFAYGSNMDLEQITERCPSARLVGQATLTDFSLQFTIYSEKRQCGCADIVATKGAHVEGLLFTLTDEDLVRMDHFEGAPKHYQRITVTVSTEQGRVEAHTYEVVRKASTTLRPSKEYLGLLQKAAQKNDFSEAYKQFLGSIQHI
jgi:gamma-glutamylcyclotransferase (GGCT)/AIG2-like uncharacterized protein YtfP